MSSAEAIEHPARWVDVSDPSREELAAALPAGLHESVRTRLEGLAGPRGQTGRRGHLDEPRPYLHAEGDHIVGLFVVPECMAAEDRVVYPVVDVVIGVDLVLTIRRSPADGIGQPFDIGPVGQRIDGLQQRTAGRITYELLDEIAERYLDLVDVLHGEIEELEDRLEDKGPGRGERADAATATAPAAPPDDTTADAATAAPDDAWDDARIRTRISDLRHDLLRIRRTLAPTRDALQGIIDDRIELDSAELFPREVEHLVVAALNKLLRAADGVDSARELLSGVRDFHQAKVANDQNEVMKRLTAIASLLLVPTFIVGVYGQNFEHIPETHWLSGYAISWGLIIGTTIAQWVYFRRRQWI